MALVADVLADRYELGIRLGSGGMGAVYRARDRLLERVVAVKVPTTTVTPASAERFKREARAAARLNHPNIVGVYDWGGGTEPFIVMELVDGRSLRAELRARSTLPPAEVSVLGAQIADALAHAHDHGIVHRDVKPSNVLVTPGGSVKVTDFGIAQSAPGEQLTETGVVLGTVGYLSPEQVAGLPADARSDIYSLGVVLTELLTGERPSAEHRDPTTELERVVARARAVDPSERHQTASELRDALRSATTADRPSSTPSSVPTVLLGAGASAAPVTAAVVDVDTAATARVTGLAVTSVLPASAATASPPAPPPRAPSAAVAVVKHRTFRRAKPSSPKPPKQLKAPKPPRPVKPMKPPKPKRQPRARTWKLRHWLVILAAPLLVVAGGAFALVKLTERPPSVAVPDVVDRNVFAAAGIMKDAGFRVDSRFVDSARPGGLVVTQRPSNGNKLEKGSTVVMMVSRTDAVVPDVTTLAVERAQVELRKRGFAAFTITPDYRDDLDDGIVTSTTPIANVRASKADPITLAVATDPHVTVPDVVKLDQATATQRLQALGLQVVAETASSRSAPVGQVLRSSPDDGATAVRGDTVTLTVSTGPKPDGAVRKAN